ncbi:MAG: RNA polymerase factor sigma-54 [Planctomycetota bacterium]
MQARLEQRASQQFALMPEMLRSVEILQLAADDLCALIEREVASNETLLASRRGRGAGSIAGDSNALAVAEAPPMDLHRWLQIQLAWRECPPQLADRVLRLADLLDERGLLPQADAELSAALGTEDWYEPLGVLQTLEPRGLGARTAVEGMLLQIDGDDPDREDIAALLTEHLDQLARHRTAQVAHALGLSVEGVAQLVERIRSLNPRPAADLTVEPRTPVRVELEARLQDGEVVVRLRGGDLPELRLHPRYQKLARAGDASLRRYLRAKLAAARGFIRAVDLRQRTLLRVAGAVLRRQIGFLQHGVRQLQPLRMVEIAEELGCHTSTVSRALAGKWVSTDHGVFALRGFFDGAHLGAAPSDDRIADGGAGHGQRGVQERVRELIAAENPTRPLSDDQVAALLRSEGIAIARRTIAKYRSELGIRSQWQRRSCSL